MEDREICGSKNQEQIEHRAEAWRLTRRRGKARADRSLVVPGGTPKNQDGKNIVACAAACMAKQSSDLNTRKDEILPRPIKTQFHLLLGCAHEMAKN
jgi:hypothetical protein